LPLAVPAAMPPRPVVLPASEPAPMPLVAPVLAWGELLCSPLDFFPALLLDFFWLFFAAPG
jgi:hypothetical protein